MAFVARQLDESGCAMAKVGDRAVVLGASMADLLAARALSDFFETVTVVDRDMLPEEHTNRRGIPQGRHLHALLAGGAKALEKLFPGILDELVADRAPYFDGGDSSKLLQPCRASGRQHRLGRGSHCLSDEQAVLGAPRTAVCPRHRQRHVP
ncbi:hypothetical protein [uncultured Mycobacterium sp.]|uniref:hypothetical protein n=1 Tax=uncultured Mycobacterium sp. TaxID=171292 RepID=UPI0035C946A9